MDITQYPDIIAIGIPFMVACLVIEFFYDLRKKEKNYRWNSTISNVSCGIFEQATGFISKGLFVLVYIAIYQDYRLTTFADTAWLWVLLVIVVDLIFYIFHRLSHRCSFLWSGHLVHHEVDKFNLSVALRRSVLQEFTIILFYLPLAIVGVSPAAFFLVFSAHNLYQFLIHTRYLPEFKVFGLVFNTPFHHEIHHCKNKCYVDKNFAGVFIIWDKLFGTFAKPSEAYQFGIGQQTRTLNPILAQIDSLKEVIKETKRRRGLVNKLTAFFGSPSYLGDEYRQNIKLNKPTSFSPTISARNKKTIFFVFLLLLIAITIFRNYEQAVSMTWQIISLAGFSLTLFGLGMLLDNKTTMEDVEDDEHQAELLNTKDIMGKDLHE
ncbi:sterol desaturase family protein [Shewanella violacea]|uniref:Sterol desaturase family protein n=1 Tax=Shewanella violacea (strain JCM 10179 / CIP 106290 / LMG 19151 / DSS12) TaxID=637905 RepID=D4ZDP8_SHEVD|nr:sterol desaturase family protein [Shewanella violacea]BAJ03959.1 sterol desaturase family protein [Shewanella violacea DSS12]